MRLLETLLESLRGCLDGFPDKRRGINTTYSMGDIGMAAFSVFFMQSPSFLAHQRHFEQGNGCSNCASLFGIAKIPSDNHIRDLLDPATPDLLHPAFAETIEQLRLIDGGLDVFRRLAGRVLIALDGTEYHCSKKSIAHTARRGSEGRPAWTITTPCWRPRWWHRAMTRSFR
jgi:hypothetical protein